MADSEWDLVFSLGAKQPQGGGFRYRFESILANLLRKAKASVLERGFLKEDDGTFPAETSKEWISRIPFARNPTSWRKYRKALEAEGFLKPKKPGSKQAKRANIYSGFPLDFMGPRPALRLVPWGMYQVAHKLETEPPLVEYVLVVSKRFTSKEIRERYGKAGAGFFRSWGRRIDQVAGLLSRIRFEVVAGYDQGHVWVVQSEDTGKDPGEMENAA